MVIMCTDVISYVLLGTRGGRRGGRKLSQPSLPHCHCTDILLRASWGSRKRQLRRLLRQRGLRWETFTQLDFLLSQRGGSLLLSWILQELASPAPAALLRDSRTACKSPICACILGPASEDNLLLAAKSFSARAGSRGEKMSSK